MGTKREGMWDCTACGTTGILGRHMDCPGCGRSRPAGVKFYLPENAPAVTDSALLKLAEAGPDWACSFCASTNRAGENCDNCGHSQDESDRNQAVTEYGIAEIPRHGDNYPPSTPTPPPTTEYTNPVVSSRGLSFGSRSQPTLIESDINWRKLWPFGVIAFIMLFISIILYGVFHTRTIDLTVTEISWQRTIAIEVYKTVIEEDWNVPSGGRIQSTERKIHHYDRVLSHYETKTRQVSERVKTGTETYTCGSRDLGNGFFEDVTCTRDVYSTQTRTETYQEPVYDRVPRYQTWYTYEIEKWVLGRTHKSWGDNHKVFWPSYILAPNERVGPKTQEYQVFFVNMKEDAKERKTYDKTLSLEDWMVYEPGMTRPAKVNIFGQVKEILDN